MFNYYMNSIKYVNQKKCQDYSSVLSNPTIVTGLNPDNISVDSYLKNISQKLTKNVQDNNVGLNDIKFVHYSTSECKYFKEIPTHVLVKK